jgi:phospholipase C
LRVTPNAYGKALAPWSTRLAPSGQVGRTWALSATGGWYDLSITSPQSPSYLRRLAGRLETGAPSISDPAMGGPAHMDQAIWV